MSEHTCHDCDNMEYRLNATLEAFAEVTAKLVRFQETFNWLEDQLGMERSIWD